MASHLCSTPPPPGSVRTPDTPKHGFSDSWEPFSPRKSARISEKRASARTPSPSSTSHNSTRAASSRKSSSVLFSTPAASPQKKRQPAMDSVRRASSSLTAESTANAADVLGRPASIPSQSRPKGGANTMQRNSGMLPTPAKTPRKQTTENENAIVRSVARNLFGSEADMIASPRKRKAKKYSGITMDSFTAEVVEQPIAIYTDSRDRIPSVDKSSANPFYGNAAVATEQAQPEPTKRRSKRRQVTIPGEGAESIEEAVRRDDGIVYVFRGKKIFRKFSEAQDGDSSIHADSDDGELCLEDAADEEAPRRLTRSSIKPRLLFPSQDKEQQADEDDEEAVTDIEDNVFQASPKPSGEQPETPADVYEEQLNTPKAPRFAPASPPPTSRAKRTSTKLLADASSHKRPAKSGSPFDSWRVSKRTSGRSSLKRDGEPLEASFESSKRQRA